MSRNRNFKPAELAGLRTESLQDRPSLVNLDNLANLTGPGATAADLIHSLPDVLAARNFRDLVELIADAHASDRLIVMAFGAHLIKCGLSPLVIDLMERGIIKAVVTHGACAVHDYELAAAGKTSEDVTARLSDGSFGCAHETARALGQAAVAGSAVGYGRALGLVMLEQGLPYVKTSVYATAARLGIPATVHVAVGTDVVHMHPSVDGAALGLATHTDFRLLVSIVGGLRNGVYLNFGSAVVLPEVFLKALSAARNLGAQVTEFAAADFDMFRHYRPEKNLLSRPGGRGLSFTGHHEIMLPLLRQAIIDRIG